MQGKVLATKLNVRQLPDSQAKKIGILSESSIIEILGQNENWYEILHKGMHAYVASQYIQPIKKQTPVKARVNTSLLNVRNEPGVNSRVIGSVKLGNMLDIIAEHDNWIEIQFNQGNGFVSARYVDLLDIGNFTSGSVTSQALNVRDKPDRHGKIIGTLNYGAQISIQSTINGWYQILFNGYPAFVSAKYITTAETDIPVIPVQPDEKDISITADTDLISIPLAPDNQLDLAGSSNMKKVATTWNRYGGLLQHLSNQFQIETACIIAVLCVESSGDGFRKENQGRMVIRFENHKFWSYWGKEHGDQFHQNFKLNLNNKPWLGHEWRASKNDDWSKFHGNQFREWQVLEFARKLDDSAALLSISMGAPQIMGFHYKKLGYENVQTMFEKFNSDIRYQILGLFDFLSPAMLGALRSFDFEKFAGYYNGSGQKEKYGAWINDHYDAFKQLTG